MYTLAPGEGKYLYSRNPVLSICAFPQFSVDKNDHQIVNASGMYMQVISLRLSYVMWTLMYLIIFQIYFGRQNICKYRKFQIKSPLPCIMLLGQKKRKVTAHSLGDKKCEKKYVILMRAMQSSTQSKIPLHTLRQI